MYQTVSQQIESLPYKNIYWFARYLLNVDEYGGLGSIKEKQLLKTVAMLETMLVQTGLSDEEKLSVLKNTLFSDLLSLSRKDTKKHLQAQNLVKTLDAQIRRVQDVAIFCIAMKYIVCPMNHAIDAVPSDDLAFSKKAAKHSGYAGRNQGGARDRHLG